MIWTALQSAVLFHSAGLPATIAIRDSLLNNIILAVGAYAMVNIMRFAQPLPLMSVFYSIVITLICTFSVKWLSGYIVSDDIAYQSFVTNSLLLRTMFGWLTIGLISAGAWLFSYINEQQEFEQRRNANEKLAREAELSRLRQQLQPHFLFNSLNSISALAGTKPEEARKMIQQLSDFLRGTLKKDDQQLVLLAEELSHLQLYLDIEKVRFGHRLQTYIENDDQSLAMKLPSLLLQPIVENAIKFGLYDTTGEIVVRLIAKARDQHLVISVENPFDPETAKPRQGTGFGLNSVQRRLYLLYARHDLLATSQDDIIFRTTIKIPQFL